MFPYRPGDIVRVYHYPYVSKAEQVHNEPSSPGKARYGLVINSGGKGVTAIPIMPIISRSGKTEESTYRLREDEVRVPHNTYYPTRTGEKQLYGVIKTERLERFGPDEISAPLTTVPLRTKIDILERYNVIKQIPYFKNLMDRQSPGHESFMKDFEESVVAEKLNFLVNENGVRKFDAMRNSALKMTEINPITKMGKNNRISLYSVKLQGRKDSFQYTMATLKSEKQIAKDWSEPKQGKAWLKEDVKYQVLRKNLDRELRPDPIIDPSKNQTMDEFKNKHLSKDDELTL